MVGHADTQPSAAAPKVEVRDLTIHYGQKVALHDVSLDIRENEIFGIIGPANSGKTSFVRALNRMDLFTPGMRVDGTIRFDGRDIDKWRNVYALRRRIGVVFPLPVGLPMTVYDNVASRRVSMGSGRGPSWMKSSNGAYSGPLSGTRSKTD